MPDTAIQSINQHTQKTSLYWLFNILVQPSTGTGSGVAPAVHEQYGLSLDLLRQALVEVGNVVNNVTTAVPGKVLDARQGNALRILINSVAAGVLWQDQVTAVTNAPPALPSDGDRYIVGTAPTGAWAGHAGDVAVYETDAWAFATPSDRWGVFVYNDDQFILFHEGVWTVLADLDRITEILHEAETARDAILENAGFIAVSTDLLGSDHIGTVATDLLLGASSLVKKVADSIANVNSVGDSIANVNSVAAALLVISAVNNNKTNINAVAGNATNINAVNANKTNIDAVAGNATNINAVNANKPNIDAVATNGTNINAVSAIDDEVTTVAGLNTEITALGARTTEIDALYAQLPDIAEKVNKVTPSVSVTASKTLGLTDASTLQICNSESSITVTIPTNAVTAFPVGTEIVITRYGAGAVIIAGDVIIQSSYGMKAINPQYGAVSLYKVGTDEWLLIGALSE